MHPPVSFSGMGIDLKEKHLKSRWFSFLCLWRLIRLVQLPFTDIHSRIHSLAHPQLSNFSSWFAARVTDMVNLSLFLFCFLYLSFCFFVDIFFSAEGQFHCCGNLRRAGWLLLLLLLIVYIALFSALEQTHCARMWFYMSEFFIARFCISTEVVYLQRWHGWCHMKLLPSRHVLCTSYNHAPCHFMQSHIRKVHARLAVTCHLHFWQNDQGLLHATAVTRGWNGYWNKS